MIHAAALALLLGPAVINLRSGRPAGLPSPWLRPPTAVGMLLIPATLAITIADSRYLASVALSAAAAYVLVGWSTRTGGVSIPAAFAVAIAYAHLLYENGWPHPFDEPLAWMPLAAAYVAVTWALPDRRSWRFLEDAAPGLFVAGLSLAGLALILSFEAGVTDAVLASLAGVLFLAYVVRTHKAWLAAAVAALAASGFIAGDHWPPVVAAAAAVAAGVRSDHHADRPLGVTLLWISTAWWAATFALAAVWRDWNPTELVVAAAITGGALLTAAVSLSIAAGLAHRVRRWAPPAHALAQLAGATVAVVAIVEFSITAAYGLLAGVAAAEAALAGLLGTMRRELRLAGASGALAALAYGLVAGWREWSTPQLIWITATVGAGLLVLWSAGHLGPIRSQRVRLWLPVAFAVGQAAGGTVVAASWADLATTAAAGVTAGVLVFDAAVAGVLGTVHRNRILVVVAAALAAAAYGFGAAWAQWPPPTFIGVTASAAALLTVTWAASRFIVRIPDRLSMWLAPAGIVGQAAAVAVVAAAWTALAPQTAAGVTAGALAAEAVLTGVFATFGRDARLAPVAAALVATSYGMFAAWLDWGAPTLIAVTSVAGAALLVFWEAGYLRGVATESLRLWLPAAGGAGSAATVAVLVIAAAELSSRAAYGVFSAVLWFLVVLTGIIATARLRPAVAGATTALAAVAYGFGAGWLGWDAETFVAATAPLGAALAATTAVAYLRGVESARLRLWLGPAATAGHIALVAAISVGASGLSKTEASAVVAGAAGFESVVFGVIGSARRRFIGVAASATLAAASYGFAAHAAGLGGAGLATATGAAAALVAAIATLLTRRAEPDSRTSLWVAPAHGLAVVGGAATLFTAADGLPGTEILWVATVVFFFLGTHLAANAPSVSDEGGLLRTFAALSYVASAGFGMAWSVEKGAAQGAIVFGIAALGLLTAVAWSTPRRDVRWQRGAAVASAGFELVAVIGAATAFGADGSEFASTLLMAGTAPAVHGLLARRLRAVETAVVVWLLAGLLLIDEQLTLTLHGAVVLVSAALLIVGEIERQRRRADGLTESETLDQAEWVLMIAPMAMAAFSMGDRLWFGSVLFGEGLLLTAWGAASRVRRRAFLGFGGAVLAVLLSVAIPIIRGARTGLTSNTWLVIAAIAAVVFITIGSTIERKRVVIGRRLRQLGEIVENWR